MYITNHHKETAKSLIAKVEKQAKKGFNPLAVSSKESVELLKLVKPRLFDLMEKYVYRPITKQIAADEGIIEEITTLRKLIVREFYFTDEELKTLMPFTVLQHQSYLYNLIEAFYDMSLLVEQGLKSNLIKDKGFEKNIKRLGQFEYITNVLGSVIYIDTYEGKIKRYKKRFKEILDIQVDTIRGTADVITVDGKSHRVFENRLLVGRWVVGDKENHGGKKKKDNTNRTKLYRKIEIKPTKEQKEQGYTTFNMRSHHAIAICEWGYDLIKHCRGSASLMSLDHISKDTTDNRISNLRVVSRVLNDKSDTDRQYLLEWSWYFNKVKEDRINYQENKEYFDFYFRPAA